MIYAISTPRKSILQGIPKSSGTIIVKETLIHTNTQDVVATTRHSRTNDLTTSKALSRAIK